MHACKRLIGGMIFYFVKLEFPHVENSPLSFIAEPHTQSPDIHPTNPTILETAASSLLVVNRKHLLSLVSGLPVYSFWSRKIQVLHVSTSC